MASRFAALSAALFLGACATGPKEVETLQMAAGVPGGLAVEEKGISEVWIDDLLVGYTQSLSFRDAEGEQHRWREVLNRWQQAVGYVDELGRVWRYRLFEDPEHLTTSSPAGAVKALFDRREGEVRFRTAGSQLAENR